MKPKRWYRRMAAWLLLGVCLAGVAVFVGSPSSGVLDLLIPDATQDTQAQDKIYASPDGTYIAAVRERDTGTVGSESYVMLRGKDRDFPRFGQGAVASGPLGFFGPVHWTGNRTLCVVFGKSGPPDPSWATQWRDVKIVYVSAL